MNQNNKIIAFKGDPNIWFEFTKTVKVKRSLVWKELEPLLKRYIEENHTV